MVTSLERAAEAAVAGSGPPPDLAWIRTRTAERRRRRVAVASALSCLVVVAAVGVGMTTLVGDAESERVVAVESAHRGSERPVGRGEGRDRGRGSDSADDRRRGGAPVTTSDPTTSSSEAGPKTSEAATTTSDAATTTSEAATTTTGDGELMDVYRPRPGCADGDTVPVGQAPGAVNVEPLGSIWCFDLTPTAATTVSEENRWVDEFNVDTLMHRLDDGDMGYRVFNQAGDVAPVQAQHWINQNHWMVDAKGGFTGGASLRPDRSFRFEDGTLIVESDFAASIPEYGGNVWGELTVTSAPEPTGVIADNLYAYGQFGGHWSVGCRLEAARTPVCAVMGPEADSAPTTGACSAIPGDYRVSEMSFFQRCGTDTMGGYPPNDIEPWRNCEPEGPDMACRDRFRMEVTQDSITLYVNGTKYFSDAGWPAAHQLPDEFVNGEVYVYQSSWQWRVDPDTTYRYHWDRFAVNPSTGPTASEWYERAG